MKRRKFKKRRFKGRKSNPGGNKRKRMLDMRKVSAFNYELAELLNKLPKESDRRPIFASVYSKASNIGIEEATSFVNAKAEKGIIPRELLNEIIGLLNRHSRYR